jgi:hypothetical protein
VKGKVPFFAAMLPALFAATADGPEPTRVQQHGNASLWLDRSAAKPPSVKLSETLTILMRVDGMAPLAVDFTQKLRSTDAWHVEALGKAKLALLDGGPVMRWEQVFVATPLQPGTHPLQLPALQFTEKGKQEQSVSWEPVQIQITTRVAKVDASEARDRSSIEELPPLPPARPWWPWLLLAVPVLAVVALMLPRRRRRPRQEPAPDSLALAQLKELDQAPVETAQQGVQFCSQLSDVLRAYLEKRFGVPATRRTTAEFSAALPQAGPQDGLPREMLGDILQCCDLAKFAGVVPQKQECQRLVGVAREFVARTGPGTG